MKTLRMEDFNSMKIVEDNLPILKDGEALIKIKYAGICGSDVHIYQGLNPTVKPPITLGHEFCGQLYDIKSDKVKNIKIGDMVSAHPLVSCGICDHCINGEQNICRNVSIFGVHQDGAYKEYAKVPAEKVVKFDSNIDPQVAALTEPLAVAVHDIRRSGLQSGESVCIIGSGTIGIILAIVAEFSGAGIVVLSEVDKERLKFAEEMGFKVVNAKKRNYVEDLLSYTSGEGYDGVFEVSGTQTGFELTTKVARSGGTIVQVGIPNKPFLLDVVSVVLRELNIKGVRIHPYKHFKLAAEIINRGLINNKLKKIISRVYPADDIQLAFNEVITDKKILKGLIQFY